MCSFDEIGWRFRIRLSLETANYWIARGDTSRARELAASALLRAQAALARKHSAAAHKLLGDIAMREKCLGKAGAEYAAALAILKGDLMVG